MGFLSWCKDVVSSVASGVKKVASAVWEGAKNIAKKVVNTCVEMGGKVVGAVKTVYRAVKPYLQPIKNAVQTISKALAVKFPWLAAVGEVVAKGLDWLDKIGDSEIAKKVGDAIEWALDAIKNIKEQFFNVEEIEEDEAIKRQNDLNEAMALMKTEEQRQAIRFAQLINEYTLVKKRINEALGIFESSESTNFEHYLRLRATQKLLKLAERRLHKAKDLSEISANDVFLIEVGNKLLEVDPNLTDEEALRLDELIQRRYGKTLLPFVFEELIFSWNTKLDGMKSKLDGLNKEFAKAKRELMELQTKKEIEPLSQEEISRLAYLANETKELTGDINEQDSLNRAMQNYVYAAEGFLQVLEKSEEQWIEEDRDWVIEDSKDIGMLLIECMEYGKEWESLDKEQQSLIRDFANIFAKDSRKRTEEVKKEMLDEVEVTA